MKCALTVATLIASALLCPAASEAATLQRSSFETAARVCQGALPVFVTSLRARPLAIANEGQQNAFVTCGFRGTFGNRNESLENVGVVLGNGSAGPINVQCTFVHGRADRSSNRYYTKSIRLVPGAELGMYLTAAEVADSPVGQLLFPQLSCDLPPGGLIFYLETGYQEEIGQV